MGEPGCGLARFAAQVEVGSWAAVLMAARVTMLGSTTRRMHRIIQQRSAAGGRCPVIPTFPSAERWAPTPAKVDECNGDLSAAKVIWDCTATKMRRFHSFNSRKPEFLLLAKTRFALRI